MNKIKKVLLLALSLALTVTVFTACGGGADDSQSKSSSSVSADLGSDDSSSDDSSSGNSSSSNSSSDDLSSDDSSSDDSSSDDSSSDNSSSEDSSSDNSSSVSADLGSDDSSSDDSSGEEECSHTYDNACDTTCNVCGEERTIEHTYDNACDTTCNVCGEERAVTHNYTKLDDKDAKTDYLTCECGEKDPDYAFNKVVTATSQMLTLSDETVSLSLKGISEYESVVLMIFNDYNLGTDINALTISEDMKADTASHGEQTIMAIVKDAKGFEHTISVPVILVTKTLTTAEDLKLLQIQESTATVYGYYVLGGDITSTSAIVAPGGWTEGEGQKDDGSQGFCGTLDGNGYTITMPAGARGLFGTLGNSVIKNVNFTCTSINSNDWANTFLARLAVGVTLENVTFDFSNITTGPKGLIIELATRDCDFINVNINIDGAVNNLFGAHTGTSTTQGLNAAQEDYPDTLCTFTNCTINLKKEDSSLVMIGQCYDGEAYVTYIVKGCDTTEGTTIEGLTLTSPRPDVKLKNQDLLTTSETVSLDLGDYAGYTVQSIALDGTDIGTTDVSAITIPTAIKMDPSKHGTGSTYTVVVDKDGAPYKIAIPVTFVTDTISTAADFSKVQIQSLTSVIYGYYILTDNITSSTAIATPQRLQPTDDGVYGFCGTFDGRGYTVTTPAGNGGIFGGLGRKALIKDVTFTCTSIDIAGYMSLIASGAIGATMQDVTFNFNSITNSDTGTKGLIFEQGSRDCHFIDVVINITGKANNLFGHHVSNWLGFNANQQNYWDTLCTFTNCTVNLMTADSSLAMIGEGHLATGAYQSGTVTAFIVDGCTTTATVTVKVEGITIVKKA